MKTNSIGFWQKVPSWFWQVSGRAKCRGGGSEGPRGMHTGRPSASPNDSNLHGMRPETPARLARAADRSLLGLCHELPLPGRGRKAIKVGAGRGPAWWTTSRIISSRSGPLGQQGAGTMPEQLYEYVLGFAEYLL